MVCIYISHDFFFLKGDNFCQEFSHLCEICNFIPLNVHVMALTATVLNPLDRILNMRNPGHSSFNIFCFQEPSIFLCAFIPD